MAFCAPKNSHLGHPKNPSRCQAEPEFATPWLAIARHVLNHMGRPEQTLQEEVVEVLCAAVTLSRQRS